MAAKSTVLIGRLVPVCYFGLPFLRPTDCCAGFVLGVAFLFHILGDKHLISQTGLTSFSVHLCFKVMEMVCVKSLSPIYPPCFRRDFNVETSWEMVYLLDATHSLSLAS